MKKHPIDHLLNEANNYVEQHKTGKVSQRPLINRYKDDIIQAFQDGYSKKAIYHSMVKLEMISCTYASFLKHTQAFLSTESRSENTPQIPTELAKASEPKKVTCDPFEKNVFNFNPIVDEKELFGD